MPDITDVSRKMRKDVAALVVADIEAGNVDVSVSADNVADGTAKVSMRLDERTDLQTLNDTVRVSDRGDPFVFLGPDVTGRRRRYGRFRRDGTFAVDKWGIEAGIANGGLSFATDAEGILKVSLGTVPGRLPIGGTSEIIDKVNPAWLSVTTVTDATGRVRRVSGIDILGRSTDVAWHLPGSDLYKSSNPLYQFVVTVTDATGRRRKVLAAGLNGADVEISQARGSAPSLKARLDVTQRADGLALSERFGMHRLCETRSKLGDIMAGAGALQGASALPYQLVINCIGNSWMDNADFWPQRLIRRLRAQLGDAGAGFVAVTRDTSQASADPAVVQMVRTGTWTILDASNGGNVPGPMVEQASSSTAGDKVCFTQLTGASSSVRLLGLGNGAVVAVSKNGGPATNVTLSAVSTDLGVSLAAGDYVEIVVVSGTVTLYGGDFRRNQTGVRLNKLGNSASTWVHWLNADASTWQAAMTALGGDLTIMMESINGADSWDAAQEVAHTTNMVARTRAALPLTDILLLSPPVTLTTPKFSLIDRAYALRAYAAADGKMAHLDLQYAFGEPGSYGDAGHQFFTSADLNHPYVKGRPLLADTIHRAIFS